MSQRCIFCGRTERDFDGKNSWSNEHIIPESLGNSTLVIKNVCKQCNSCLGTYVDNYLVNHSLTKLYRQFLKLPSKKRGYSECFSRRSNRRRDKNTFKSRFCSLCCSGSYTRGKRKVENSCQLCRRSSCHRQKETRAPKHSS